MVVRTYRSAEFQLGPLTVFPDGLLMKGRKYAWDDIRSYEIDNGYLRINPYMKKGCQPGEFALPAKPPFWARRAKSRVT